MMARAEDNSFLGSGMKFPPQANKATGRFAVSSGAQSVKESVYLILMTSVGERRLLPEFGSSLARYAFMDMTLTNLSMLRNDVMDIILSQESRISDVEVAADAESRDDCVVISIAYRIAETNAVDNLVFPFYLKSTSEEADV
ncbi:MAG: GPW/gp25 family protein [Clostridiales Family XIII bacterium]|jgi:phage baseplate assembly protein W|nr:GPW/gp25 family protein [Clostridiales Family XIII bacterium]